MGEGGPSRAGALARGTRDKDGPPSQNEGENREEKLKRGLDDLKELLLEVREGR